MFCIECGQKLPDNAKFCCRCGAAVNNISNPTTPPIMDDVAAKAEDVVITDEMPSLDAQGVNDDVLRKASFVGFEDQHTIHHNDHHIITNNSIEDKDINANRSIKTFFGGELILETVEYSKNDIACYFVGKCSTTDKFKNVTQSSISNVFIVTRISDGKKTYLRYNGVENSLIQDIPEWFDSVEDFQHNFSVVRLGNKRGYVSTEETKVIWKFDCIFDKATSYDYFTDENGKKSDILTAKVQIKDLSYYILTDGRCFVDKGAFDPIGYMVLFILINLVLLLLLGLLANFYLFDDYRVLSILLLSGVNVLYITWWYKRYKKHPRFEYIRQIPIKGEK